ncbi:single-stranded-DNA-specific exonuclease RecJ [Staphylococcus pettenkoferi]|uniref:Single-stranded-DNA-specific exonuclease RecJ n=1 Tax=Staphylococcus pettenkoferi TaxID=170573 RepID=A0ABT4BII7_9STAP|nr:single-stranded-DNA-specific exonuclease RecJ [Staphylococcus pettenkoferi]MCY1564701.1 single-stranded-DNA-specific exonuclease RecJ [Staphylococcus pettenkoferi]MCY1572063.1 single-stranded-DNA-specific exonuclease RecJ [Staphylococcus pettenkoferi]MCY1582486.1 single-stranded-DNA-specific exonuclease RecJ [Staphylococcus pettenkoferi]MCY1591551.1 single-stranded-DNA-specific exonuclease RecJ [Staphylococcus pettenkoferi]MCY1605563.1 single-stranded-DNA-specific exonuclease RecJ [Staphylo
MIKPKYNWLLSETNDNQITDDIAQQFKLTPIMKQVLESKAIITAEEIERLLKGQFVHDPATMSDMTKAVERINQALDRNETILVYGDYDADGVTSTTILVKTLRELGAHVGWYIPNRFSEGYGPNELAFQNAVDEGVSLIITVDNGIQGHDEIKLVQDQDVDVIVTDHHEIGPTLPEAYAIVHPMHPDYDYPFKYLCGAGVAYKLAQTLLDNPPSYFKALVAIGTIADLVSMTDENRTLVKEGLAVLNQHLPVPIKALLQQAGFDQTITEETIGFIIGPRLNAVGRLEDASLAAELLMTDEMEEAQFLAEQVEYFNNKRKDIVQAIADQAMAMAQEQVEQGSKFLLLAQQDWHEGVLGIVASRVVETYHLPTLILNIDEAQNHAKGSARSIDQVSMFEILSEQSDLITKFGGHHMAAGMTLSIENIEPLHQALDQTMQALAKQISLVPTKKVDVEIAETDVSVNNIRDLQKLRPFGTDFAMPCFKLSDINVIQAKGIGQEKRHLKLTLGADRLQALYWQHGQLASELGESQPLDLIGTLEINEWNGHQSPQLMIQDLASNQLQILDYRSKNKHISFENSNEVAYIIRSEQDKPSEHYYYYGESFQQPYEKYVMMELPETLSALQETLKQINNAQIYLVLAHQHSVYFEGIPKMESFKACYKAIYQKGNLNLASEGMQLCEYLRIKPDHLKFILRVFYDLDFIKNEEDLIVINPDSTTKAIDSSSLYQARQSRIEVEQLLLYEDFNKLKSWIKAEMNNN